MIKVNALKRSARMNQRVKSFAKIVEVTFNLPNDMMDYEDPSTPLLQVLLSFSTDIIKDSYQHLGGNMGELPYQNKCTVAASIMCKWGESIWAIRIIVCIS